ncbi:hypothetical protein FACS1894181_10190 [Bacteroidia bacterium]|nr:hypothetical protein FACS1894181_10190 [Bacteroidia bacterium]
MKKILYLAFSFILAVLSGCTHKYPDGEGTLTLEVGLTLNLQWESFENLTKAALRSAGGYSRRFIVEVRREGRTVFRQTLVPGNFIERQTEFTLPEPLMLHALEYTLAVWSDYAATGSADGLHYNTSALHSVAVNEPYTGNTDRRDCHYAVTTLDLRPYRDRWNAKVRIEANMTRPLAKYRIIATDAGKFIESAGKKFPGEKDFGIRFTYGFYFPVAFNVWEGKPSGSRLGVAFEGTLSLPDDGAEEVLLGSDYIFTSETGSYIPLVMEIFSLAGGNTIGRFPVLNVPYRRGYVTTLRGRFLSAFFDSGGIGIDPGFDGDININLDNL